VERYPKHAMTNHEEIAVEERGRPVAIVNFKRRKKKTNKPSRLTPVGAHCHTLVRLLPTTANGICSARAVASASEYRTTPWYTLWATTKLCSRQVRGCAAPSTWRKKRKKRSLFISLCKTSKETMLDAPVLHPLECSG
jgi:hypothetical protein